MKTKQDGVVGRISEIRIFSRPVKTKNRLEIFLNIKPEDKKSIIKFCEDYKFFPREYPKSKTLLQAFADEQSELKNVAIKAGKKELTQIDIDKINSYLLGIKKSVVYASDRAIEWIEGERNPKILSWKDKAPKYLVKTIKPVGICTIWNDLVEQVVRKQDLKMCLYCGTFFKPNKHAPWQKFCFGTNCKDSYHNKKRSPTR